MNYRDAAAALFNNMSTIFCQPDFKKQVDFSRGEINVLALLAMNGPLSPGQLISLSGNSSPHIAKSLRNLEGKKLITRTTNRADKRKVIIEISEEGRKTVHRIYEEILAAIAGVLEKLGSDKSGQLLELTAEIGRIVSTQEVSK